MQGLSMAASAGFVTAPETIRDIEGKMGEKFPQPADMAMPEPSELTFLRLRPKVVSVPDYSKGFGPHRARHAVESTTTEPLGGNPGAP